MPMVRNQLVDDCTNETLSHQEYGVPIATGQEWLIWIIESEKVAN